MLEPPHDNKVGYYYVLYIKIIENCAELDIPMCVCSYPVNWSSVNI